MVRIPRYCLFGCSYCYVIYNVTITLSPVIGKDSFTIIVSAIAAILIFLLFSINIVVICYYLLYFILYDAMVRERY